jgi:hypothetical protein
LRQRVELSRFSFDRGWQACELSVQTPAEQQALSASSLLAMVLSCQRLG